MKERASEFADCLTEMASGLANALRTAKVPKERKRNARNLLKQAYDFEEALRKNKNPSAKQLAEGKTLARNLDHALESLAPETTDPIIPWILNRYAGPHPFIGDRINPESCIVVSLQAEYFSRTKEARFEWFYNRCERARDGISTRDPRNKSEESDREPEQRESFELIWRKQKGRPKR